MPHFWLSYATVGRRTLVRTGAARGETGLTAFGDLMTFHAAIADGLLSRRRRGRLETVALVSAAVALALGVAAWVSDSDQTASLASAALPQSPNRLSFDDRFSPLSPPE